MFGQPVAPGNTLTSLWILQRVKSFLIFGGLACGHAPTWYNRAPNLSPSFGFRQTRT